MHSFSSFPVLHSILLSLYFSPPFFLFLSFFFLFFFGAYVKIELSCFMQAWDLSSGATVRRESLAVWPKPGRIYCKVHGPLDSSTLSYCSFVLFTISYLGDKKKKEKRKKREIHAQSNLWFFENYVSLILHAIQYPSDVVSNRCAAQSEKCVLNF